mmetsp:Transcript_16013/g.32827  ORF Transcript_16013/g.32827 Transcript_16013/m.32827 type:complete len:480 (+) Transcript_16013:212-1651(+)|eukprot:CAMPEP_0118649578 /NCGR_PEP_ID=MMETSP0785-20121206/9778_1 /TAXON_ID=91992 /ORGANISM="Bolidomonas pacifica, Strain CCMP 1866" /LENGTH=479 /DNA_ID=CAMNT_0006541875 /DNA_START=159 /DNA_END=1598 /DNA_ORIENTATION=-
MAYTESEAPAFLFFFCISVLITGGLLHKKWKGSAEDDANGKSASDSVEFKKFQKTYLVVYFCVMAGDWLQGPYVYALYDSYGFDQHDIAVLFVAGFGSSMIFGTFLGSFADRFGRKNFCLIYIASYILSCLTKHVNSYNWLMLGRLLGGVSTSLLYSVFDSWMINEHNARTFDQSWLSDTFAMAIFGNSVVAILAGLVANAAAGVSDLHVVAGGNGETNDGSLMNGGFCAPFDVAILILIVGGLFIKNTWGENYGSRGDGGDSGLEGSIKVLKKGFKTIVENKAVMLCGLISSLFEGSMFTFVFMWTPALTPSAAEGETLPFGLIFATFMVACMAGSTLFSIVTKITPVEEVSKYTFCVASASLFIPVLTNNYTLIFVGFLVFEGCVGLYFPAIGTLKGMVVPESQRSAIYNIFRIPLNVIVLVVLLSKIEMTSAFFCCAAMLFGAALCQFKLVDILKTTKNVKDGDKPSTEVEAESLL